MKRRFTADDAASRIVVRHRAAAVGRGTADDLATRIVERARLLQASLLRTASASAAMIVVLVICPLGTL